LKDIEIYTGDVRDYDSVYDAMKDVDVVFHLAALIGIAYSYVSPLAYIKTNTEGTYNILEAGRKLGLDRIVVTSTSEIYGTAQYVPIDEKHPYNPQSPYAASKAARGDEHVSCLAVQLQKVDCSIFYQPIDAKISAQSNSILR